MNSLFLTFVLACCLELSANAIIPPSDTPRPAMAAHEFHMSRLRMEYNASQREWQITLHVFIDDVEKAIAQTHPGKLYLGTERETADAEQHLLRYIRSKLKIWQDSQVLNYTFVGKETGEELNSLWIYLIVEEVNAPPTKVRILQKMMTDIYDDQQNMIQVFGPGNVRKSVLMNAAYVEETIAF